MKKQLQKKFSAFIVTAMMFSAIANAQIVYTNVNPDTTVNTNNGVYHLDINNDGIIDFNITYTTTVLPLCGTLTNTQTNIDIRITPLGANKVGNDSTYTTYPSALPLNSNIDSSFFIWKNNANQILTEKYWQCRAIQHFPPPPHYFWGGPLYLGSWNGAVDEYIPLQLDVSSQKYYGWVRLNVATDAVSFTVKDYAYNSIPDQPILAGQTVATGINENSFASSINLFPNPADNYLTIALGSNNKKVEVTITDITGKVIYTTIATDTQKVEVDTEDFAEGVYVVRIQSAGFTGTKKLVVKK